jgi:hypothetical protein
VSVEREFAHKHTLGDAFRWYYFFRYKNANRDGQIKRGSFLLNSGRGEIYRDSLCWEMKACVL